MVEDPTLTVDGVRNKGSAGIDTEVVVDEGVGRIFLIVVLVVEVVSGALWVLGFPGDRAVDGARRISGSVVVGAIVVVEVVVVTAGGGVDSESLKLSLSLSLSLLVVGGGVVPF